MEKSYTLANFHFHAPSEHRINGKTYDLEMHSVFSLDGSVINDFLVLGIIFELDDNAANNTMISALDMENLTSTRPIEPITSVPLKDFYSSVSTKAKYNYKGSLTTPNCSENVEWFVVKEIQKINSVQLARFTSKWGGLSSFAGGNGNNRIVQSLNTRQIFLTRSDDQSKLNQYFYVYSQIPYL